MSTTIDEAVRPQAAPRGREVARARFPPRPVPATWQATGLAREDVRVWFASAPFIDANEHTMKVRRWGLGHLLDWLEAQPGSTWQERWTATGADSAGRGWRKIPARWRTRDSDGFARLRGPM
ncbi:hypothetical protein [Saccharopolyspora phatthalungensis]|uniref:Uncharacterized protein n=1 Tax=Saccharopolyspora phatthalungensis TaxID=664693 RepID=A0A840QBZ9_9PSEU|nr:hypothetical protein [Saccharopolyspora phatthalungensis]MBB5157300.1 hypothetical protein [Saccharopolyspora phatthalungensis]